jgi:hypothetical protein
MKVIKKMIRFPFQILGLEIIKAKSYKELRARMQMNALRASKFYFESLENKGNSISDAEYLQFLELKYGGPVIKNNNPWGGDRMNVFYHDYSLKYSQYLSSLRHENNLVRVLEVGILNGIGLAVWSNYFTNKEIYGFDCELSYFEHNKNDLIRLGAFIDGLPVIKRYDQFADNSKTLSITFADKKLDVVIDDAFHSDESIINTFNELQPYLKDSFVYFIEDNQTAWKKLQYMYPNYVFDYNCQDLTVVTRK